jgi:hypothetical protein
MTICVTVDETAVEDLRRANAQLYELVRLIETPQLHDMVLQHMLSTELRTRLFKESMRRATEDLQRDVANALLSPEHRKLMQQYRAAEDEESSREAFLAVEEHLSLAIG